MFALLFGIEAQGQTTPPPVAQKKKTTVTQHKAAGSSTVKTPAKPLTTTKNGVHTPAVHTSTAHKTTPQNRRPVAVRQVRQQTPSVQRYTEIQQALADKGYYKGPVNGEWGADSVESLKRFQAEHNLESDGKLGSLSLIALGLGPQHTATAQATAGSKPSAEPSAAPLVSPQVQPPGQSQ
jgi:peptidoglycan hydrolase-like protein with peptidoglycan-binding domain